MNAFNTRLDLDRKVFTSLPQRGDAKLVHEAYRQKLKTSFHSLLHAAEKGLKSSFFAFKDRVQKLDISSRFEPEIYFLHHQLQTEMRNSNATAVRECINRLEQISEAGYYAQELSITGGIQNNWELFVAREAEKSEATNARGERSELCQKFTQSIENLKQDIYDTINLICQYDPVMAEQIDEYVSHIVLFEGKGVVGMTDVRVFGSVFLRVPEQKLDPLSYFSEHLIHETSHLHLNALMAYDPIITNDLEEKYDAPIRLDKRPMFGVFHATYVLSRIVRFFRYLAAKQPENQYFSRTLTVTEEQFAKGLRIVLPHARCTEMGRQILESFETTASSLLKAA